MATRLSMQEEHDARDMAKINRKKELYEQRRIRILNAKKRIIGLDVDELDKQVEEKNRLKQYEREAASAERNKAIEIEKILEAAAMEEKMMRKFQMQQITESWESEKMKRELMKTKDEGLDFDPENSGPASLQKLAGEDYDRIERLKLQKEQMSKWVQEQIAEKKYFKKLENDEDMSYAEMIKAIDEIRDTAEKEEIEMRKFMMQRTRDENKMLAQEQKERNATLFHTIRTDSAKENSLDLFNEDQRIAVDENGKVTRKDMFKGLTTEQRRRIFLDNQKLIRDKMLSKEQEAEYEREWARHQSHGIRAMEEAEYEETMMRKLQKEDQLAYLRRQIEKQNQVKQDWINENKIPAGNGFYDRFGKSCR